MYKTLLLFTFLLGVNSLFAQDPHFSNYSLAPISLSPAFTGMMEGNHRIVLNHREQWRSVMGDNAFKTYNLSYDFRFCSEGGFGGVGLKALADRSGSKNFTVYNVGVDLAYNKALGDVGNLAVGAELGIIRHEVDLSSFKFDSQFDGVDYNSEWSNLERFNGEGYTFLDISAGLLWYNKKQNLFAGLALHHINNPNYAIRELEIPFDAEVDMKMTLHASGIISLTRRGRFKLLPKAVLHRQGNLWQVMAGTETKLRLSKAKETKDYKGNSLYLGALVRLSGHNDNDFQSEALLFTSRFVFDRHSFGVSYDLNISSLRKASDFRGALEISIMTVLVNKQKSNCIHCPTDF